MEYNPNRGIIKASKIDSMETVEIGDIQQSLYFRGEDLKNPVILFLHGGPGYPEMPFLHEFQYTWEEHFTIVHWDQRNTGKSFFLNDPEMVTKSLSFERVLNDAYEVTQYIREKLKKDKIIILGYSWGTALGVALVQSYPQYFSAYIGLGQVVNLRENERIGFEALLESARSNEDSEVLKEIEALAPYPPTGAFNESFIVQLSEVRKRQIEYGIATGNEILDIALASPYYTQEEKGYLTANILMYQLPLIRFLYDEYDIHKFFGTSFEIPVFIIMGDRDFQTPHTLARSLFEEISAPQKAFFLIPDAGHGAMLDNKAEFDRVLLEEIKPLVNEGQILT